MYIVVANGKGGVGKSTVAINLAALFHEKAPTLLVDADPNQTVLNWEKRRRVNLQQDADAFKVCSLMASGRMGSAGFDHWIYDTEAGPDDEDLGVIVEMGDRIIMPCQPTMSSLVATQKTAEILKRLGSTKHKVLLTKVPTTHGSTDEAAAREFFQEEDIPVFDSRIRFYKVYEEADLQGCAVGQVKRNQYARIAWGEFKSLFAELWAWEI